MKNYVQPGKTVTLAAPFGGVKSGEAVLVGSLFGVAAYDALVGANVEVSLVGVFDLPKASGDTINQGGECYWDVGSQNVISAPATSTTGMMASPSRPSVRLTALLAPTITK